MQNKMIRCIVALAVVLYSIVTPLTTTVAKAQSYTPSSSSAVVMEASTGRVLFESNADERLPMASTTKIMTALVAIENGDLDEVVEVDPRAIGVEGSSIYLQEGEKLTLRELLFGLMLRSGNDAAEAIAYHIGGSIEGFVDMMNKKAKSIGADNTNFENPHGLPSDNHYTTAYNLALISANAMMNPDFKEICQTKYISISGPEGTSRSLKNKNKLLWEYEGGNGIKTGYTKAAGKCLVSSAEQDGMQIVCVVLNSSSMWEQCTTLMDEGFDDFDYVPVLSEGEPLGTIPIEGSVRQSIDVFMDTDVLLPLTDEEKDQIFVTIELEPVLVAPVTKGKIIGSLKVAIGDVTVMQSDIILKENIQEKTWGDWLNDILNSWQPIIN